MIDETYINASHIVGLSEMDKSSKNFIACQSPTDSARFWKMIMQEKVEQIRQIASVILKQLRLFSRSHGCLYFEQTKSHSRSRPIQTN